MNTVNILMEKIAGEFLISGKPFYTDDWCWNDDETVVEFTVMEFRGIRNGKLDEVNRGRYRFVYDADDVFGRDIELQALIWVEEAIVRRFGLFE